MGRGGFADKVAHGEEVAVRVGGEGRRRDYFGGEGAACCGGGDYLGGVLCALLTAACGENKTTKSQTNLKGNGKIPTLANIKKLTKCFFL